MRPNWKTKTFLKPFLKETIVMLSAAVPDVATSF